MSLVESSLAATQSMQIPHADLDNMFGLLTALVDFLAPLLYEWYHERYADD